MAIVPLVLFSLPRVRQSRSGQWTAASLGVFGVRAEPHRCRRSGTLTRGAGLYLPSWTEVASAPGVVPRRRWCSSSWSNDSTSGSSVRPIPRPTRSGCRNSTKWDDLAGRACGRRPHRVLTGLYFRGSRRLRAPYSATGRQPRHRTAAGPSGPRRSDTVDRRQPRRLRGAFPHEQIAKRQGGEASCVKCHHMNLPRDQNSGCYECHQDMYLTSDAFRHDWHASPAGAHLACGKCHDAGQPRSRGRREAVHRLPQRPGSRRRIDRGETVPCAGLRAGHARPLHRLPHAIGKGEGKPDFARCSHVP